MPALAMVAAITAFSSGVSATSFWPMLDMPSAAASGIDPDRGFGDLQRDRLGVPSRPNECAVLRSASVPVSRPNWTNAVLHDRANACTRETVGSLPHGVPP